jgi:Caudovirus prohead serine protease
MITGLEVNDQSELIARGSIDVTDHLGRKIHRMLRDGALQWSIGGWWGGSRSRDGDVTTLELRDLGEISIVPVPANPRTSTRTIKGLSPSDLTDSELKQWAELAGVLPPRKPMSPAALKHETDKLLAELGMDEASRRRDAELRKRADYAIVEATLGEDIDADERREAGGTRTAT